MVKIDLHVHSKYSVKPTNWILKQFSMPESYTLPQHIYDTALARGMTHVTITDHDSIGGCLEIAHLPNTFVSCEVTVRFPQDKCKVHVLCYGLTEAQFSEIDAIRGNIYELVSYLRGQNIYHAVAHPIYPVNNKLTQDHVEQLLVMFGLFELSGFRSRQVNDTLRLMLGNLSRAGLEEMADKHGIEAPLTLPENKHCIGGTDDHSGLFIARTYTENPADDFEGLFLRPEENRVSLVNATPLDLSYSIYAIGYQYLQESVGIDKWVPFDSSLKNVASFLTMDNTGREFGLSSIPRWFVDNFTAKQKGDAEAVIKHTFRSLTKPGEVLSPHNVSQEWFESFAGSVDERAKELFEHTLSRMQKQNVFNLFRSIGSAAALYFVSIPYYVSYKVFQDTRIFAESLDITGKPPRKPSVTHFTDTFYEINGVALTMQQMAKWARELELDYTFVTCSNEASRFGEKVFKPITDFGIPEYPQQKLTCPPLLKMINYCYEQNFTHIHAATPGPMGIVALLAAKLLRRPFYTTYHTAFPQYVGHLTGDQTFEEFIWVYMRWFYNMADRIFVPSRAFKEELVANGIRPEKIALMPRGIDTERFKPNGGQPYDKFRLLYVGRISKEKNLQVLADAVKQLNRNDITLTLVGDGPFRAELEEDLQDFNVEFRGYLTGDDLVNAYCESDIFVFPSTTDTFGNVILEAHACGVPTIVTDSGGPQENVIDGETGLIVPGGDVQSLKSGIESLLDKEKLWAMGIRARQLSQDRTFDKALLKLWEFYQSPAADVKPKPILDKVLM